MAYRMACECADLVAGVASLAGLRLWTINGGSHGPTLSAQFSPRMIDWLLAHPKP